jgi:hypothetical protein
MKRFTIIGAALGLLLAASTAAAGSYWATTDVACNISYVGNASFVTCGQRHGGYRAVMGNTSVTVFRHGKRVFQRQQPRLRPMGPLNGFYGTRYVGCQHPSSQVGGNVMCVPYDSVDAAGRDRGYWVELDDAEVTVYKGNVNHPVFHRMQPVG